MTGIAFLIPIALLLGLGALAAFFWSLGNGQYEDLDGASLRILNEEEGPLDDKNGGTGSVNLPRQSEEP